MESGAVKAVLTDKGRIETDKVVCAAGAWASKVGRMVGVHLPQRVAKGTVVCTEPTDFISYCTVMTPDVTFRQKRDGTFYVSNGTRSDYYVDLQSLRNFGLFIRNFLRVKKTMNVHVGKELFEDVLRVMPGSPAKAHPFAHTVGVEPEPNGRFVEQSISHLRKPAALGWGAGHTADVGGQDRRQPRCYASSRRGPRREGLLLRYGDERPRHRHGPRSRVGDVSAGHGRDSKRRSSPLPFYPLSRGGLGGLAEDALGVSPLPRVVT